MKEQMERLEREIHRLSAILAANAVTIAILSFLMLLATFFR